MHLFVVINENVVGGRELSSVVMFCGNEWPLLATLLYSRCSEQKKETCNRACSTEELKELTERACLFGQSGLSVRCVSAAPCRLMR